MLANRDFHLGNVLAARREPWLLIDPKPLVGEAAFDTGHFLRSLLPPHLNHPSMARTVDRLATGLKLEPKRIRAWAFVRSVEDALLGLTVGQDVQWDLSCARILSDLGVA